jgi:hypothetical protein
MQQNLDHQKRCPKDLPRALRAAPRGVAPPMGQKQDTSSATSSQKGSRFPPRACLRYGCGCVFQPGHWNQRYCRKPECQQELRRWQAKKRQRDHRRNPENRRKHAETERQRRKRRREERRSWERESSPSPAPGHAEASRAWSRGETTPENFCDRPGCYNPVRPSCRAPARYCSDECRQALHRVEDRERKYKWRKRQAASKGRNARKLSAQRDRRQTARSTAADRGTQAAPDRWLSVRGYRSPSEATVSSRETRQEVPEDDRETSAGCRPRAPPSA